jgi:RNA recognition motif-containing protein
VIGAIGRQEFQMGTRLYVGNLPFSADETQIRDLFSQGGRAVSEVKLVTDRDPGRPRGFGFVEMGSNQDADGAIRDLNGMDFGGRPLTVNEAKERTSGGGGGGGGRGGNNRW